MKSPTSPWSCLVVSLLGAAPVDAQSSQVVIPARYATVEAEAFTGLPFNRSTPVRVQHWYAPSQFPTAGTVREVAFRPDGAKSFTAKGVDLEIFLGTGSMQPEGVRARFADNRGFDWSRRFGRKQVLLPAVPQAAGPRPFLLAFALDRPFPYDPKKGGLLLEVVVHGQQPGRWELDLGTQCRSARADFGRPGCRGSNGRAPLADCPTQSLLWGGSFVLRVRQLLVGAPVALLIGTMESGQWGGLQLPFPLDAIGAKGCTLNTEPAVIAATVANNVGEARVPGRLPPVSSLVGKWFRFQALALDRGANPLGLTFSNGSKTQICGPDPVVRVVATSLSALSGQIDLGVSPVARFAFP